MKHLKLQLILITFIVFLTVSGCDTAKLTSADEGGGDAALRSPAAASDGMDSAVNSTSDKSGVDSKEHLILLEGTENTRDLGGYPCIDGQITRERVFIRSEYLIDLTQKDMEIIFDTYSVDCIVGDI